MSLPTLSLNHGLTSPRVLPLAARRHACAAGRQAGGARTQQASRLASMALLALSLAGIAGAAQAADLVVRITAPAGDQGMVMVAVAADAATFLKAPLAAQKQPLRQRGADGSLRLVFTGLAPGRYAVTSFLDLNGNGDLDRNLMGIPTEPYGFSNGAKASFGPPTFDQAAVVLDAGGSQADVALK